VDGDDGPIKMERKHLGRISSIGVVVKGILGANAKQFCSIGSCMPESGDFCNGTKLRANNAWKF
jgi:hypothetical protein